MRRMSAIAALSTALVATAGMTAAPAQAGGHHGTDQGSTRLFKVALDQTAAQRLDKRDVDVDTRGAARKWTRDEVTVLGFPLRSAGKHHRGYGGGHGSTALRGAVVFDGSGHTVWRQLRVDERHGVVTAKVAGDRVRVLRFASDDGTHGKHARRQACGAGGSGGTLTLTRQGARSLDRAAGADAFDAGEAFGHTLGGHR